MLDTMFYIFLIICVICLSLMVICLTFFGAWKFAACINNEIINRKRKTMDRRELGKKIFELVVDRLVKCGNKIAWSSENEREILMKIDDVLYYSERY